MAYDETRDVLLKELDSMTLGRGFTVEAEIRSYDGGPPKVSLARRYENKEGKVTTRNIGRFSRDELAVLAAGLSEIGRDSKNWFGHK